MNLPYAGDLELDVRVTKGKHVNVYVVDPSSWAEFKKAYKALFGGQFRHYPEFAATKAATVRRRGRLAEGQYYIVIENPTYGILVSSSFDVQVSARLVP